MADSIQDQQSPRRRAVLEEIQLLAARMQLELPTSRPLSESDRLVEDLQLDSMTLTAFAVALEDRFRIALTDAPPGALDTIGGLADYIARHEGSPE